MRHHHRISGDTRDRTDLSFKDTLRETERLSVSNSIKLAGKPTLSPGNQIIPNIEVKPETGIKMNVDLNNDGIVNVYDLNLQLANYGSDNAKFDHNHDGVSDQQDIDVLLSFWGMEGQIMIENPDIDGDGIVGSTDLGLLLANYGSEGGAYDLNNDGKVNQSDLDLLLGFWTT